MCVNQHIARSAAPTWDWSRAKRPEEATPRGFFRVGRASAANRKPGAAIGT
jgi:hypothetical protein